MNGDDFFLENGLIGFKTWLSNEKKIIYVSTLEIIIECFKSMSKFAIDMEFSQIDFAEIKRPKQFEILSEEIRRNKLFVMKDKLSKGMNSKSLDLYYQYLCYKNEMQNPQKDNLENVEIRACNIKTDDRNGQLLKRQQNLEKAFITWLINANGFSENASRISASAIKFISDFCMEANLLRIPLISITSAKEFDQTAKVIRESKVFKQKNRAAHNKYSSVLTYYGRFLNRYERYNESYEMKPESKTPFCREKEIDTNINGSVLISESNQGENTCPYNVNTNAASINVVNSKKNKASDVEPAASGTEIDIQNDKLLKRPQNAKEIIQTKDEIMRSGSIKNLNKIKDVFNSDSSSLFEVYFRKTAINRLDKQATLTASRVFCGYCDRKGYNLLSDLEGFNFRSKSFIGMISAYKAELLENYWVWFLKRNRELDYKQNKSKNNDSIEKESKKSEVVRFDRGDVRNACTRTRRTTVNEALVEFSNNYKGEIKTRREIVEELSVKYGHNEYSILPADYEIGISNHQPKLFKRIDHGTYLCLGYDTAQTGITALSRTQVDGYSLTSVDEKSKLIFIVADKFKNGFRMSSSIDFERFKNYYADEYGKEFQYAADRFHYVLSNEALVFDDRAYVYGEDVSDTVRMYLEQMNSSCIYIDAFFNKFSDELYAFTIFSVDMLRAFIEKNYCDISMKWDYILLQESKSPSDLIKDVFGERETWSLDELQERLPCLKIDTIRQTLNGAEYYRVDKGTYTHINNMDLPENEGTKIIAFVVSKLQERDYVTANELDLSKFENLNPHCSFAAVRDAVFYKFLSNNYDKSGQVITRKGGKLRVLDIMEQYCREADAVSFDELNAFEATFDPEGRTHSQCLIAGHNTMVRVSSDLFVFDGNVDFDVARIDGAIALYCHGNFIPLRGVTDFSLFPYAGYQWNLFLLESYVRRFSHVFKFDVRAVNSANIGAIVRKSFDYNDYDDILALALAKSSVRLSDKKAVGDYLFNNGYIGWRNLGKSEGKIIKSARELREGGTV